MAACEASQRNAHPRPEPTPAGQTPEFPGQQRPGQTQPALAQRNATETACRRQKHTGDLTTQTTLPLRLDVCKICNKIPDL